MRNEHSETVARKYERQGFIVVRTYKKGCPDLIVIDPKHAHAVRAREVKKNKNESATLEQYAVLQELNQVGIESRVEYPIPEAPTRGAGLSTRKNGLTKMQKEILERKWFRAGYKAQRQALNRDFGQNKPEDLREIAAAPYLWKYGYDCAAGNDVCTIPGWMPKTY